MCQRVLPLLPADAVGIGPLAGPVENEQGGVVIVNGIASFAFAADDVVGRRLAAVQLVEAKTASVGAVTAAFGLTQVTLWRWREAFAAQGVSGLVPAQLGPKGPSKLRITYAVKNQPDHSYTISPCQESWGHRHLSGRWFPKGPTSTWELILASDHGDERITVWGSWLTLAWLAYLGDWREPLTS